MKKIMITSLFLWLLCGLSYSLDKRVGLKVSYFSPEDQVFLDVYGRGVKFGIEGGIEVVRNLEVWVGVDYLHKTGKLTLTKEETKLQIIPISLGMRYEIPANNWLDIYLGAGIQDYLFKEKNILGTATENKIGIMAKGGGVIKLSRVLGIDVFVGYSFCSMKHGEVEFKVGGLDAGAGLKFVF